MVGRWWLVVGEGCVHQPPTTCHRPPRTWTAATSSPPINSFPAPPSSWPSPRKFAPPRSCLPRCRPPAGVCSAPLLAAGDGDDVRGSDSIRHSGCPAGGRDGPGRDRPPGSAAQRLSRDQRSEPLNRAAAYTAIPVEKGLFELLQLADRITRESGGAFDVSAGALIKAWGFYRGPRRVPSVAERAAALDRVGMRHVLSLRNNAWSAIVARASRSISARSARGTPWTARRRCCVSARICREPCCTAGIAACTL